jgi:hypothetical protein
VINRAFVAVEIKIRRVFDLPEVALLVALSSLAIAVELRRKRPLLDHKLARAAHTLAATAFG